MISKEKNILVYRAARKISKKHGYSLSDAMKIARSQFEFVAHHMRRGTLKGILLPNLGTFAVNPHRLVLHDQRRRLRLEKKNDLKKKK